MVGIKIIKQGGKINLDQDKLAMQIVEDYQCPIVTRRSALPTNTPETNPYDLVGPTE